MTRAAIVLLIVFACACSPEGPERRSETPALRTVSLPDLSRTSDAVRQQLRKANDALAAKQTRGGTPPRELGASYGEVARLLMAAGYLDAAEPAYLNARALMPDDVRWPYLLGHLYRLKQDLAKAADAFSQVLALTPADLAARVWLGTVLADAGRLDEAEAVLEGAVATDSGSAAAHFRLGSVALAKKDYARAIRHLEAALTLDPQASSVHYPLAIAHTGAGNRERAERHLQRRGTVDVTLPDPLMRDLEATLASTASLETLGVEALDRKDWRAAADYFRKGLELAPDSPSLRHRLGTALFMMGDQRGALREFEETVRRAPDYARARYSLGVMLATDGRPGRAIDELAAAVRHDPGYVEARLRLAELLRREGRAAEALPHYDTVIRSAPRQLDARLGQAITLVELGRHAEARDRLAEAIDAFPDEPVFAHALARVLAASPDPGVRDGRRALDIVTRLRASGQTAALAETTAMALAATGSYAEAADLQRQLVGGARRAGRASTAARLAQDLARYERRQPAAAPWHREEPLAATLALR